MRKRLGRQHPVAIGPTQPDLILVGVKTMHQPGIFGSTTTSRAARRSITRRSATPSSRGSPRPSQFLWHAAARHHAYGVGPRRQTEHVRRVA